MISNLIRELGNRPLLSLVAKHQNLSDERVMKKHSQLDSDRRKLTSLSAPERRDYIFCLFIELEGNRKLISGMTPEEREEAIELLEEDVAELEGSNLNLMPVNWDSELKTLLNEKGVEVDDADSVEFIEMRDMLHRAYLENKSRSLEMVKGHPLKENDLLFKGLIFAGSAGKSKSKTTVSEKKVEVSG